VKKKSLFILLMVILAASIILSLIKGSVTVELVDLPQIFSADARGNLAVVRDIRIPRVIIAVLVGANLSVAGVLLQAVMRNPLADPGITGISSGASATVMCAMLYFPGLSYLIPIIGFAGSAAACSLVYLLAWKKGITAIRIVLAGVAVNAVLGGFTGLMSILNSEKLGGVLSWLNGSLSGNSWQNVTSLSMYSAVGLILAFLLFKNCNLLALGDKSAKSLGLNPNMQRLIISGVAVFLAGISTSFAGVISFVGLVIPHISRMLVGSNHKVLIPFSAFMGASVLLLSDTFGRNVVSPYEIPVGIIMSLAGGPFFLYLLRKGSQSYGS
jgi:iron complex transport system permease protein